MKTAPATFGQRLKALRAATGLTTEQLGERAGLPGQTIRRLECGLRPNPPLDTLIKLSDALGCKLDEFRPTK